MILETILLYFLVGAVLVQADKSNEGTTYVWVILWPILVIIGIVVEIILEIDNWKKSKS